MARMNQKSYPSLKMEQLQAPLIFVVDMINGFAVEGALADSKISEAATPIRNLIEKTKARTIFVRDAHTQNAREFESYPVHCLAGSKESEVMDALKDLEHETILKNSTNTFMAPDFQKMLGELEKYKDIVITGCCTDLCVMQFALSLQGWLNQQDAKKIRIVIPADCVDTYHIENVHDAAFWNEVALANMAANGIVIVNTIEE